MVNQPYDDADDERILAVIQGALYQADGTYGVPRWAAAAAQSLLDILVHCDIWDELLGNDKAYTHAYMVILLAFTIGYEVHRQEWPLQIGAEDAIAAPKHQELYAKIYTTIMEHLTNVGGKQ